jgi:hypothetical protein
MRCGGVLESRVASPEPDHMGSSGFIDSQDVGRRPGVGNTIFASGCPG